MTYSDVHICTSVFAEAAGEESTYPQVPGISSSPEFQAVYWRSAVVSLASSYRHQPEAQHVLFTNIDAVPTVDGVDIGALLRGFGVELAVVPLTFAPPPQHYHAWRGCFYAFDIAHELQRRLKPSESAVVLDADCVFVAHVGPVREAVVRDGALTYVLSYPVDWAANGLSREAMSEVASELLGFEVEYPLVYCGAEVIAATGSHLARLVPEIDLAWTDLVDRCSRGDRRFITEEHVLSYVYYKLRVPVGNGNPFIRRIWTGSFGGFNNALPTDHGLVVWHVPGEKRFGIRKLFGEVVDAKSPFWSLSTGTELRNYIASCVGVPRNAPGKLLRDFGTRVGDKLRYR